MNSHERVLTAISHRTPDRLPITFDCAKEVRVMLKDHFHVASDTELWQALHVDTWLAGATHHHPNISTTADGVHKNFWGYGSKEVRHSYGTEEQLVYSPLQSMQTLAEIDAYSWPKADEMTFEKLFEARHDHPDSAVIAYITLGGYFISTFMRGMEQFLLDMAAEPRLARGIITHVTDFLYPAVERLCVEAGDTFDIFYMADDYCSALSPLMSPAAFREFIQPYLKRIAQIVHAHHKYFLLHVCGSVRKLLPDILAAGVDILEPIQTSAVGMEPEALKRDFGAKLTFYGGVDLVDVLNHGTPATVRQEVLKLFHTLGRNGGYILGPGHTYIQPDTPLENILMMYETAYTECRY